MAGARPSKRPTRFPRNTLRAPLVRLARIGRGSSVRLLRTRELDDIAIGVREVQGPLPPRTVGRRGQHVHARGSQALVLGVRVVDEEGDLSLGPGHPIGGRRSPDQLGKMWAGVEAELRPFGGELRVGVCREPEGQADRVPIEADRALEVRDEQDE